MIKLHHWQLAPGRRLRLKGGSEKKGATTRTTERDVQNGGANEWTHFSRTTSSPACH
jgi:hypothetical protein